MAQLLATGASNAMTRIDEEEPEEIERQRKAVRKDD